MPSGPAIANFTLYRGVRRTLVFTVVDDDGALVDVSGWTSQFTARKAITDPDPAPFIVPGAVIGDGTAGQISVDVSAAASLTLAASTQGYDYSLERTDTGNEDLLAKGKMSVSLDVKNAKATS